MVQSRLPSGSVKFSTGNEIFAEHDGKYTWHNPRNGMQQEIHGLRYVYKKRANNYRTIQLVNYGGKLVIMWNETRRKLKRVWCAVISLEERSSPLGTRMRGRVEQCDVVLDSVHNSYMLSRCLSVSV
ncbi:unnamed protein product [Eruca vesicaria subsp. sativa]|uniref:Uncharacterized protein n=1 Tax=Eruca vesicaria subsp. sativa TaxID=29727 RepID=A0ABC8KRL0_ERUVS|nr:unnamed protein product [Eruca vesicaria subsp. sativa]